MGELSTLVGRGWSPPLPFLGVFDPPKIWQNYRLTIRGILYPLSVLYSLYTLLCMYVYKMYFLGGFSLKAILRGILSKKMFHSNILYILLVLTYAARILGKY